jgi:AcrR family transcriptional regulator
MRKAVPSKTTPTPASRLVGKISRDRVLEAAIRIGDEDSLSALTMRRLASELGVGTMTLYSYFRNKNELLDGVADAILGSLALPSMNGRDIQSGVRLIGHSLRNMMREHPTVVRLFSSRTTRSERAMQGSYEQVLQAFIDLGLEETLAVRAYGILLAYTLGFSAYELPRPWGRNPNETEGAGELRRQRRLFYEALPKAEFPAMVALSDVLVTLPSDQQFDWGLDVIVAGILAQHGLAPAAGERNEAAAGRG